ncbi:MAG: hypothetical protein V5A43_02130 [Haloarculaceae archaeon]
MTAAITATADAQKALTSLSNDDATATADAQKALTSLAVAPADILASLG